MQTTPIFFYPCSPFSTTFLLVSCLNVGKQKTRSLPHGAYCRSRYAHSWYCISKNHHPPNFVSLSLIKPRKEVPESLRLNWLVNTGIYSLTFRCQSNRCCPVLLLPFLFFFRNTVGSPQSQALQPSLNHAGWVWSQGINSCQGEKQKEKVTPGFTCPSHALTECYSLAKRWACANESFP